MNPILLDKDNLIREMMARDPQCRRLEKEQSRSYGEYAWEKGQNTARSCRAIYPSQTPDQIAREMRLTVTDQNGPGFYLSEYSPKSKTIVLFENTIKSGFIKTEREHLCSTDYTKVRQLFLAHELFHHLECSDPNVGLTHRERKVTVFSLGPFRWTSGLRCLSEIAAHSFALYIAGSGVIY